MRRAVFGLWLGMVCVLWMGCDEDTRYLQKKEEPCLEIHQEHLTIFANDFEDGSESMFVTNCSHTLPAYVETDGVNRNRRFQVLADRRETEILPGETVEVVISYHPGFAFESEYGLDLGVKGEQGGEALDFTVTLDVVTNVSPYAKISARTEHGRLQEDSASVLPGERVLFDGRDSKDGGLSISEEEEGTGAGIARHEWDLLRSPEGSRAEILASGRLLVTLSPDMPGEYEVGLTVYDDFGMPNKRPSSFVIEVVEPEP